MAAYKPTCVKDVSAEDFIKAYSAHLKSNDKLHLPTWVDVVKTGKFKELAPYDEDWYFVRAAAICRRLYNRPGIGIGRFQTLFGGRMHRGAAPEKFSKSSGGLVRHIMQSLEEIGILEKCTSIKGGRKLTASGQRDMDVIAGGIKAELEQL
ncbi:ribosomal protein S19 component of cytosolic 80S ribosome and 40S small subunit [Haematococcus lacustris]|uniref:40S ribosomal protein S19 n=2 Tax=Haematococcus lacustris TaxID=44745 RepID=A0A699YDA6_HAELA|nr:hypothetical protein QJQ45_020702 [Haematococcus lacustris]GFH05838.1 uncharacterized protein HaLaN_00368 [Haematococcus lacustris]